MQGREKEAVVISMVRSNDTVSLIVFLDCRVVKLTWLCDRGRWGS